MARLAWVWPSGGERWRKPAIVVVSLGLHAVVLGYMAFDTFDGSRRYDGGRIIDDIFPGRPVIYVQIEPRPLLRGEVARTRETPAPDPTVPELADSGARITETTGATGSAAAGDPPTSPSPRAAARRAPTPPPDVGTAPRQVRPDTIGDGVGRGLRTSPVGCASPRLLSPAERAVCDHRLGERAAAAAPIEGTGNPRRDGRFARAGARALARYEARRAPLSAADDPPCDRPRSPVADCELEISVDLYSSTRGWLPNLRGDDE